MPSKKVRAKLSKGKDSRTIGQIYRGLPKLKFKPLENDVLGHSSLLETFQKSYKEGESLNGGDFRRFIDVETKEVDKEYLDNLKLWIDETGIIQGKCSGKPLNDKKKSIIKERCQRVYEYAEMKVLYDRQQKVMGILRS